MSRWAGFDSPLIPTATADQTREMWRVAAYERWMRAVVESAVTLARSSFPKESAAVAGWKAWVHGRKPLGVPGATTGSPSYEAVKAVMTAAASPPNEAGLVVEASSQAASAGARPPTVPEDLAGTFARVAKEALQAALAAQPATAGQAGLMRPPGAPTYPKTCKFCAAGFEALNPAHEYCPKAECAAAAQAVRRAVATTIAPYALRLTPS